MYSHRGRIGTGMQIIQDLAIAIMGGLLFAIVINLFIVPLFFCFVGGRESMPMN